MLSLNEFYAGCLGDAKPMSLFMPGSKHQHTALVVGQDDDKLLAVTLDGQHAFVAFECSTNEAWQGMIAHPISIEVDEKSLFDLSRFDPPLGALSRKGDSLRIYAKASDGFRGMQRIKLISGLASGRDAMEVGFTKWRIVIGASSEKRELFVVERPRPTSG